MRFFAALMSLFSVIACTSALPPAEPIIEDPVIIDATTEPCVTGDGDGIGGTGCPVD